MKLIKNNGMLQAKCAKMLKNATQENKTFEKERTFGNLRKKHVSFFKQFCMFLINDYQK